MNVKMQSTRDLLEQLVGKRSALKFGDSKLTRLFDEETGHRKLQVAREIVLRLLAEQLEVGDLMSSPANVSQYLQLHFKMHEAEAFLVLFLDHRHRLIRANEMFRGTVASASVHPREVVKEALRRNAAAAIVAHNHPSGVAEPSAADIELTSSLRQALALVDVRLLDHFVVAGGIALSLAERGLV